MSAPFYLSPDFADDPTASGSDKGEGLLSVACLLTATGIDRVPPPQTDHGLLLSMLDRKNRDRDPLR
jgi:hypothetical protein